MSCRATEGTGQIGIEHPHARWSLHNPHTKLWQERRFPRQTGLWLQTHTRDEGYWITECYLAVRNSELWIFIIKPIQIKMPIFILQTVPFQQHQQYLGQNTKHACSWWNFVLLVQDQHKRFSKQTFLWENANAKTLVFQAHIKKSDLLSQIESWSVCV